MALAKVTSHAITFLFCLLIMTSPFQATADETPVYIGAETCGECHPDQYDNFIANSKKAKSYTSVSRMAAKLTSAELKECYSCHTTGYGHPGGFISEQETPHLKNSGCEVCHGPGSLHIESEDPADLIESMSIEDCRICHNSERVAAFNFKPLMYGGAH